MAPCRHGVKPPLTHSPPPRPPLFSKSSSPLLLPFSGSGFLPSLIQVLGWVPNPIRYGSQSLMVRDGFQIVPAPLPVPLYCIQIPKLSIITCMFFIICSPNHFNESPRHRSRSRNLTPFTKTLLKIYHKYLKLLITRVFKKYYTSTSAL